MEKSKCLICAWYGIRIKRCPVVILFCGNAAFRNEEFSNVLYHSCIVIKSVQSQYRFDSSG